MESGTTGQTTRSKNSQWKILVKRLKSALRDALAIIGMSQCHMKEHELLMSIDKTNRLGEMLFLDIPSIH